MNAPIRLRLTAWYVLVLAVVLTGLGWFVVTPNGRSSFSRR